MPRRGLFAVVALLLVVVTTASAAPDADGRSTVASSVTRVGSLEQLLLRQINAVRAANGLTTLSRSTALTRAAAHHSHAMATFGFFTHESRDGGSFSARVGRFYQPRLRAWSIAENLAMFGGGAPDAASIVASWMGSPPHRANLLGRSFRDAGLAVVHHPAAGGVFGGRPTWVITLDLGVR